MKTNNVPELTLFYDGGCPLCAIEMRHLKRLNTAGKLAFVDIMDDDFAQRYPHLEWQALNDRIHGQQPDGTMLIGLDVTYQAWKLVGRGWVYAPLRWPLIKPLADRFYLWFARHRYKVSYWLTGQKRCLPCEAKK
ncbi:thiol-disulfide oxidoreductase DCC family protein [Alteromonas gilva]|uniref:DUF393 domain-containing protein n=1 Tax=Alteromonas gilva TaxID=2987522 RepID=A0ABT5L8R5_9ALTE|nr:DUF393 domain-containing protein [Alteromonas gilva]MDC8832283.1 DUF393 domain-containing protein [Alteromonas gilva]